MAHHVIYSRLDTRLAEAQTHSQWMPRHANLKWCGPHASRLCRLIWHLFTVSGTKTPSVSA